MSPFLFYPMATASVIFALAVVLAKSPVRSALALVAVMSLLAVFFAFLQAHLLAALQIIVYAGAVMVLFLFVITLLNLESDHGIGEKPKVTAAGFAAGAIIAGGLALAMARVVQPAGALLPAEFGTTVVLARQMFGRYLVAFELTSLLLLVAVVGSVVLAKRSAAENAEEVTGH
ncbi:MAG TPA: NADH-quinone oxidoreductase subunit J [Candidatus Limnocylindrales bacterium]|nr:NADH-quinone oxidoreductase subunit J [Candidatus Limnocylindrales bacterium]